MLDTGRSVKGSLALKCPVGEFAALHMSAFGTKRTSRHASRSLTGFPRCFSGRNRGNNIPKLFNKSGHYFDASQSVFVKPPKADIGTRNVRFVPNADIEPLIRSRRRRVRHCRLGLSILRLKVSAFGEHERCRHVIAHKLIKLLHRKQLLFDAKCRQFFPNRG